MMAKKRNDTIIFIDKDGKEWSGDNLQDLIDAIRHYRDFKEIADYYDYNF